MIIHPNSKIRFLLPNSFLLQDPPLLPNSFLLQDPPLLLNYFLLQDPPPTL